LRSFTAPAGREEDIIEQIRAGANIGQNTDSARMGNYVPGIAIMNGPYFAENLAEVEKLTKAPTIKAFHDNNKIETSRVCGSDNHCHSDCPLYQNIYHPGI
jgi:TRAP-type C4-dicarboxylate transport system substrate-binding protein